MTESDYHKLSEIMDPIGEVRKHGGKDGKGRNGLYEVRILHDAQTMPNERINQAGKLGLVVSCVVGTDTDALPTSVYFDKAGIQIRE